MIYKNIASPVDPFREDLTFRQEGTRRGTSSGKSWLPRRQERYSRKVVVQKKKKNTVVSSKTRRDAIEKLELRSGQLSRLVLASHHTCISRRLPIPLIVSLHGRVGQRRSVRICSTCCQRPCKIKTKKTCELVLRSFLCLTGQ